MHSTKSANPISPASPSALKAFFLASRPKTWIASLSPVFLGTVMSATVDWPIFLLTILFSLLIQIGTNFANDYFDFINGVDSHLRNGPKRATQEGWISPSSMLAGTLVTFACALIIAAPLIQKAGLWSLFLALICIAFGLLYTGGPKPLGYLGLGELLVFIFFGPVAVCGTYFLQTEGLDPGIFLSSLAPGLLSCSILIANNLRDEKNDRAAGKHTLVVRFGRRFGSWEYTLSVISAALIPICLVFFYGAPSILLATSLFTLLIASPSIKKSFYFRDPLELISLLQASAFLTFIYTVLFCTTLLIGTS